MRIRNKYYFNKNKKKYYYNNNNNKNKLLIIKKKNFFSNLKKFEQQLFSNSKFILNDGNKIPIIGLG